MDGNLGSGKDIKIIGTREKVIRVTNSIRVPKFWWCKLRIGIKKLSPKESLFEEEIEKVDYFNIQLIHLQFTMNSTEEITANNLQQNNMEGYT